MENPFIANRGLTVSNRNINTNDLNQIHNHGKVNIIIFSKNEAVSQKELKKVPKVNQTNLGKG